MSYPPAGYMAIECGRTNQVLSQLPFHTLTISDLTYRSVMLWMEPPHKWSLWCHKRNLHPYSLILSCPIPIFLRLHDLIWKTWNPGLDLSEQGQWQWLRWLGWFKRVPSPHACFLQHNLFEALKLISSFFLQTLQRSIKNSTFICTPWQLIKCNYIEQFLITLVTIQPLQEVIGLTLTSQELSQSADQIESPLYGCIVLLPLWQNDNITKADWLALKWLNKISRCILCLKPISSSGIYIHLHT